MPKGPPIDLAQTSSTLVPLLSYDRAKAEDTQRHSVLLSKLEANGEVRRFLPAATCSRPAPPGSPLRPACLGCIPLD